MATRVLVKEGELIRLNLQLSDGEDALPLIVKAFLKDHEGQLLQDDPIELFHVGLGLFKNATVIMPDVPEVTAQYLVYENDGTTLAPYSVDIDIFTKFVPTIVQDVNVEALISKFTTESMVVSVGEDEQIVVEMEEN